MLSWPNKDPSDRLDYAIDWTAHLDTGDTLSAVEWSVTPAGLTLGAHNEDGNKASVWIEGGLAGTTYTVTCRAVTTAGRQYDRSARLFVTDR